MSKKNGKPRKIKWVSEKPDPAWSPFKKAEYFLKGKDGLDPEIVVQNSIYAVAVYRHPVENIGAIMHLVVERLDKKPVRQWEDLQRIKNEVVGPEIEACELFPAEGRKLESDKVHLWCLPPNQSFPFGFIDRLSEENEDKETQK
jgi:hypothetical protein